MGALSRHDEHAILIGCGALMLGVGSLMGGFAYVMFKLAQWVFS